MEEEEGFLGQKIKQPFGTETSSPLWPVGSKVG